MSGIGKWGLGTGLGLLAVAVLCSLLGQVPASVITGVLGLIGLGIAGYDAIYNWLDRADLRRRGSRAARGPGTPEGR